MPARHVDTYHHLGLLLGTEAPVITPNGVDFSFLSTIISDMHLLALMAGGGLEAGSVWDMHIDRALNNPVRYAQLRSHLPTCTCCCHTGSLPLQGLCLDEVCSIELSMVYLLRSHPDVADLKDFRLVS